MSTLKSIFPDSSVIQVNNSDEFMIHNLFSSENQRAPALLYLFINSRDARSAE